MSDQDQLAAALCAEIGNMLADMRGHVESEDVTTLGKERWLRGQVAVDMQACDRQHLIDGLKQIEQNFRPRLIPSPPKLTEEEWRAQRSRGLREFIAMVKQRRIDNSIGLGRWRG